MYDNDIHNCGLRRYANNVIFRVVYGKNTVVVPRLTAHLSVDFCVSSL